MSKIRLDKCVLSAKKLKCRIFSASFITKTKSTSKMSQANFLFYASMKMSRKIKKPMNWTAAKKHLAAFLLSLSHVLSAKLKMCKPYVESTKALQSESTQLTPNLSLLPNLERRQTNFGTGNYFSVLERAKKKIEMDFVTFIGFLATSQVFKADGWFMVLQGGSRALWSS